MSVDWPIHQDDVDEEIKEPEIFLARSSEGLVTIKWCSSELIESNISTIRDYVYGVNYYQHLKGQNIQLDVRNVHHIAPEVSQELHTLIQEARRQLVDGQELTVAFPS